MMHKRPECWIAGLLFVVVGSVCGTMLVDARQYEQKRRVVSGGGHSSVDATGTYRNTGTIGQASPVGCLTNSKYTNCGGFWGGRSLNVPVLYTLSVVTDAGSGSGRVIGPGIDCPGDCTETYTEGRKIELEGLSDRDSGPVCWKLDSPDDPDCHTVLPSIAHDITVYAMFERCLWPADVVSLAPADGAQQQALNVDLAWEPAERADSYAVFFGAASLPPQVASGVTDTHYEPGPLEEGVTYFWRIDAKNACGTLPGPMWTFTTMSTMPDEEPPVVTVSVDRDEILLGESVTITSTATDNVGVTEFQLTAKGVEIATVPGTLTYTPAAAGADVMMATAKDAAGYTGFASTTVIIDELPVPGMATIKFYEGFDPIAKTVGRDFTLMIFTPQMRSEITDISISKATEDSLTFPAGAAWYFTFRARAVVCKPVTGVQAVLFSHRTFESVTAQDVKTAAFETWPDGNAVTGNDVVVVQFPDRATGEPVYVKLGNVQAKLDEMQVQFSYEEIILPSSP